MNINEVQVNIKKFELDWTEIKNLCRHTVNKEATEIAPNDEWKKKLLISQHSPIRHSLITIEIKNIPYCYANHFVRHGIGNTFYMTTSRSDRVGIDRNTRSQTDPVSLIIDTNIQGLLNISQKRLCLQASKETMQIWGKVVLAIGEYDENVAWALVPSCVRCGGCIEGFGNCNFYEMLMKGIPADEQMDLMKRYDIYNEYYQGRVRVRKK